MKYNETFHMALSHRVEEIVRETSRSFEGKIRAMLGSILACEYCGKVFLAERAGRAKFCSDTCRTKKSRTNSI